MNDPSTLNQIELHHTHIIPLENQFVPNSSLVLSNLTPNNILIRNNMSKGPSSRAKRDEARQIANETKKN